MAEEEKLVESTDVDTSEESSPLSEKSSVSEEKEQTVPLSRFQEVYGELKEVKSRVEELQEKKSTESLSPEEKKELDAKQYLQKLIEETIDNRTKVQTKKEQQEQRDFEESVNNILLVNPDVKKDDFLKFVEEKANIYNIQGVEGAMKLYRDLNNLSKTVSEKTKEDLKKKPNLPKSDTSAGSESRPTSDKGKSLSQIANEIASGLEGRK
jgi:hypothetical protein